MDEWRQPSEEEQRRMKVARERSNKISKILGDYLLKGYKMLGSTCNKCKTILLEDRQGEDYCVGCIEVDNTPQPDVTQVHISPHARVSERVQPTTQPIPEPINVVEEPRYDVGVSNMNYEDMEKEVIDISVRKLLEQIKWANECLANIGNNTTQRTEYVVLIKTCYETLELLRPGWCSTRRF